MSRDTLPDCCRTCRHKDWDYDELRDIVIHFCDLNLWWPRETCKRQEPIRSTTVEHETDNQAG